MYIFYYLLYIVYRNFMLLKLMQIYISYVFCVNIGLVYFYFCSVYFYRICCLFEFFSNLLIKFYFYKSLWILLLGCYCYKVKSELLDVFSGKEYKVIFLYIGNCQERLGMLYEYEYFLFDWL